VRLGERREEIAEIAKKVELVGSLSLLLLSSSSSSRTVLDQLEWRVSDWWSGRVVECVSGLRSAQALVV
jgi:hypothetical protein